MSEPELPRPPPKRPYDSLFTPRQAVPVPPATPRRPYDSLFTHGRPSGLPPPPPLDASAGRFRRAWHAFKYAGPPRLPPLTAKFVSYLPLFLLLWKGNEWTMNEIMVYQHPAFVSDAQGRLQWGGRASLFGVVGIVQEAGGGVAFARLKWAFHAAFIINSSERTRRSFSRLPVLGWFEDATAWAAFKVLPAPLAAGLTPFARRPWDEPEESRAAQH
ncbi:hypothetical protein CC85DRAFT_305346 [Cutaneotrichosporon oleaginosum]|uniref:Uncharacterized protein n=1 Tax=Cutaneotrichosporon oleaginosum TaxID=879819 RepID=A0A0J0XDK0_9TREE|nr:uncharacterized protein CC85DRAFT_305346 [Cutaneotrichosporon oleaginosum]KLT39113.1 hypothetical protein CC85DRAFT_305346 [Cutaneotrichosporon oleaginosum]TXT10453.1 hypothetical protein COLE_04387 [Cutaneotrichosporon oleaginosum]